MTITGLEVILLALATFRLTRLIVFDKISQFLRSPFHEEVEEKETDGDVVTYIQIKGTGLRAWIGELLSCYWCTGIWCAATLIGLYYIWADIMEVIIIILAVAGAAGVLETIINRLIEE
ncbi:DUF1360 domain-containing protein [Oceanobacillus halophilus]|uniref:DUF1360 domain-containing protein n=1 Tax=Oceanobacillus halophilus TaxID=930130 RepID=A0A495ACC9_9BACI|nr:DUF1360 domain-containing protein [Oceanobacillus halophilus]RKQ37254.1 DUF1360 domain-containing protein [Oceanobacillus halophilus]